LSKSSSLAAALVVTKFLQSNLINGRESVVNTPLDGSTYPVKSLLVIAKNI
jgi:hypothetical protein